MRKIYILIIMILFGVNCSFADTFTDVIQDLDIKIACKCIYSSSETGGGWYDDPHDYYTPQMMASRFAVESGEETETTLKYGICFNYAKLGYEELWRFKQFYNNHDVYENQFYLAGVHENSNQIILSYPTERGNHNVVQNGVYVKEIVYRHGKTHGGAIHHAWLWIQRADGVWFWIDPTWTDNLGYVVYGYVSKSGEEIQCRPNKELCINYPSHLNNLPFPPAMGERKAQSSTVNSTRPEETVINAGKDWIGIGKLIDKTFNDVDYSYMSNDWVVFMLSANVPYTTLAEKKIDLNKFGLAFEIPLLLDSGDLTGIPGFEYLHNLEDKNNIHSFIFEYDFARRLFNNVAWFIGGGFGLRFDFASEGWAQEDWKTSWLALKGNTGFIINVSSFFTKVEASYNNVYGFSVGVGIGWGIKNR